MARCFRPARPANLAIWETMAVEAVHILSCIFGPPVILRLKQVTNNLPVVAHVLYIRQFEQYFFKLQHYP